MFKETAIMHGKDEFSKIKGSVCDVLKETANPCNILLKLAFPKG